MTNEANTRQKILSAAGPIFAKRGYQKATVRDISVAAGVNLASINYYFGDKSKLYLELLRQARDHQGGGLDFPPVDGSIDAEELLERFVTVLLRKLGLGEEPNWQMKLLVNEFLAPSEAGRQIVEEYFAPYFESLLTIIDRIAGRTLSRAERLRRGFSVIGQCLHYRLASPIISMLAWQEESEGAFDVEPLARHIAAFSVAGIRGSLESATNVRQ